MSLSMLLFCVFDSLPLSSSSPLHLRLSHSLFLLLLCLRFTLSLSRSFSLPAQFLFNSQPLFALSIFSIFFSFSFFDHLPLCCSPFPTLYLCSSSIYRHLAQSKQLSLWPNIAPFTKITGYKHVLHNSTQTSWSKIMNN